MLAYVSTLNIYIYISNLGQETRGGGTPLAPAPLAWGGGWHPVQRWASALEKLLTLTQTLLGGKY